MAKVGRSAPAGPRLSFGTLRVPLSLQFSLVTCDNGDAVPASTLAIIDSPAGTQLATEGDIQRPFALCSDSVQQHGPCLGDSPPSAAFSHHTG